MYQVTGSDASVYPPMSTQLREAGIDLMEGYRAEHLHRRPDCVVVGNAMSRGNPAVEFKLPEDGSRYLKMIISTQNIFGCWSSAGSLLVCF